MTGTAVDEMPHHGRPEDKVTCHWIRMKSRKLPHFLLLLIKKGKFSLLVSRSGIGKAAWRKSKQIAPQLLLCRDVQLAQTEGEQKLWYADVSVGHLTCHH